MPQVSSGIPADWETEPVPEPAPEPVHAQEEPLHAAAIILPVILVLVICLAHHGRRSHLTRPHPDVGSVRRITITKYAATARRGIRTDNH